MTVNVASQFSSDVENYIQEKTLPLLQRNLVAYQFGDRLKLPKNNGTTYTASRYDRVPLPFQPLSESVPPSGQSMTVTQVQAVAQLWGDTITVTAVADMTIKHPTFQKAIELIAKQQSETVERNTFNALMSGTQVNFANGAGSRAGLGSGDELKSHEINRVVGSLRTLGAPEYMGQMEEDAVVQAGKPSKASADPRGHSHYVAILHPLVEQDLREDTTVLTAWQHSDINRLYNSEIGEWGGTRFTRSNMVPSFTGAALVTGTAGTAGALATDTYFIQVTASDANTQYETIIHQVSAGIAVTGPTGSISVTVPATAGYTYSVYIGTTASPVNLGTSTAGPTTGPLAGQATQIAAGATAIITDFGIAQAPPAAPATGITVYPTFVFGRNSYGIVMLDDVKYFYIKDPDHSDPLNQLRTAGWKMMYGTIVLNQNFFARIESTSAFNVAFS